MTYLNFDLLAELPLPTTLPAQLWPLLVWAFTLFFWAIVYEVIKEAHPKEAYMWFAWSLFGGLFITGWGTGVQSAALNFCRSN